LRTRVPARKRAVGLAPEHSAAQSRRSHDIGLAAAPRSVHGFAAAARPGLTMKAFARVRRPDLAGQGPRFPASPSPWLWPVPGIDVTTHTRAADMYVQRPLRLMADTRQIEDYAAVANWRGRLVGLRPAGCLSRCQAVKLLVVVEHSPHASLAWRCGGRATLGLAGGNKGSQATGRSGRWLTLVERSNTCPSADDMTFSSAEPPVPVHAMWSRPLNWQRAAPW
jgi:hypothetical protein